MPSWGTQLRSCLLRSLSGALAASLFTLTAARAAEEVSLHLGGAQRSIDVDDLTVFVTSDEIPDGLRWYARQFNDGQVEEFRELLVTPFEIDPITVSSFVKSQLGEALLKRLLVLFKTNNRDTTFKALRAALVLAAFEEDGLSILNVIEKWPLRQVRLDFNVALKAIDNAKQLFVEAELIGRELRQKAVRELAATDLPPLPDLSQAGPYAWRVRTLRLSNPDRQRLKGIFVDLYVPSDLPEPAPLLVISHGFASSRDTFAYLAEHLASHGFAVAAIEHPTSSTVTVQRFLQGDVEPVASEVFIERPKDISVVLDELESLTASDGVLYNRIAVDRVGVIGQSLGGYTALAVGGASLDFEFARRRCDASLQSLPFNLSVLLQCRLLEIPADTYTLKDDRVAAVLALNPITSSMFGPLGMSQLELPLAIFASKNDFFAPAIPEQIYPFVWAGSTDKHLILVEEGTHFSFLGDTTATSGIAFDLPAEILGPDPSLTHPVIQAFATAFFEIHLADRPERQPYLSNSYLRSIAAAPFTFSATQSLDKTDVDTAIAAPLSEEGVNFNPSF
ncbi:alpha/beta hydrolase [Synechococcus sp. PCC 7336]|uniref:alpha/beta hydrolase n=1 Tax=Synechococcus sp. PCC 7336 TaxID=195250 RepID=UPI000349586F|nr:alpha/beta hydrolase [Synechococcus sp. PCC 7336]